MVGKKKKEGVVKFYVQTKEDVIGWEDGRDVDDNPAPARDSNGKMDPHKKKEWETRRVEFRDKSMEIKKNWERFLNNRENKSGGRKRKVETMMTDDNSDEEEFAKFEWQGSCPI